ncbi:unnamed protein product [Camellia sinensis]
MDSSRGVQTRLAQSSGKKKLEHRELMGTIFTRVSATGHHWTLGRKVAKAADVSSNFVDSIGAQPFIDPIPAQAEDVDLDSSIKPVQPNMKRKRTPSTSCGKSKKATSGASVIAESMNNLINVVCTQNQQVTVRHLTDYREVMMCQPDDDHIVGWLTQKQLQSSVAALFANLFGAWWV